MSYERRSFAGGAAATTLASGIDASTLTVTIDDATGWPTGSTGDFGIVIDRGTASEEKCLVDSRSGTTLTVASGSRGIDGTTGVTHALGATVEHCALARDLDEANAHIADTTLDHHTQYLDETRHDVEARHTFGAALGTPAAAADIGTTAAAGTGDNPAREDHVHQIGSGAIDASAMFAAGVVDATAIAANAVGSSELADSAVDTAAIADDAVTAAKLADGAVDAAAKFGTGVVSTAALADSAVTSAKIAAGTIATADIADDAVTGAKIADAALLMAHMSSEAGVSYTPTLTNVTLGTGGTRYGRYFKFGRLVVGVAGFALGSGGDVTAGIQISLPFTVAGSSGDARWIFAARGTHDALRASGMGVCEPGETVGKNIGTFGSGSWDSSVPWDWSNGDTFIGVFLFEATA